jgi:ABC-type transporter MlaC component
MTIEVVCDVIRKQLMGDLLTIADASSPNEKQQNAMKSLIRQAVQKAVDQIKALS